MIRNFPVIPEGIKNIIPNRRKKIFKKKLNVVPCSRILKKLLMLINYYYPEVSNWILKFLFLFFTGLMTHLDIRMVFSCENK